MPRQPEPGLAAETDATLCRRGAKPMKKRRLKPVSILLAALMLLSAAERSAIAQQNGKKPNILFIMGDDIGMWNIGAYHRGMMAGRTPNLDQIAKQGMMFTDYYA